MTITNTSISSGPYAAVADTTFAVDFYSAGADELEITLDGSVVFGWTFSRDADGTGEVTFATPVTGEVIIFSKPDFTQQTEFQRFGAFYPDLINPTLDRAAARDLFLLSTLIPEGSTRSSRVNKFLAWDANGNPSLTDARGAPGGNTESTGLFTSLVSQVIPPGTDRIRTTGFHTLGKGSASYTRWSAPMAALPAWGQNVWWRQAFDGSRWMIDEDIPTSDQFGTFGDAARAYLSPTVTGTDVTLLLNKLTYYAQSAWGKGVVVLSQGGHRTSDTIHLGTGDSFRSVRMIGEIAYPWGTRHDNQANFPSAEIKAERNDRPAVNIQAARTNSLMHVSIEGPLYATVIALGLGRSDGGQTLNDVSAATWLPASALHTNGQFNPGCGVAIDAFSGTAPAGAYPAVGYVEATTQYGKPFSSEINLEGVKISGFSVGVACQPCDADGNGDFLRLNLCSTTECIYGVSIGNSQARNVEIRDHTYIHVHTFIVNNKHGKQRGKLGGPLVNISGGQSVQLFDLNMGFAGDVEFRNHYSEGLWRFGNAIGQGRILHNGDVTMTAAAVGGMFPFRGTPANIFGTLAHPTTGAATESQLELSGSLVLPSVGLLSSSTVIANGLRVISYQRDGSAPIVASHAQMNNALCGGLFVSCTPFGRKTVRLATTFLQFNVLTGAALTRATWDGENWQKSRREVGCPHTAQTLSCVQTDSRVPIPHEISSFDHTQLVSKSLVGTTFTFTITGISSAVQRRHLSVGDVIWHENTDCLFLITARSTDNFTCTLLNNHLDTGGTITHPQGTPNLAQGSYYPVSGRYYLPDYPVFGDFTSGNATITNVGTAEGFFGTSADFVDNDALAVNSLEDFTIGAGRVVSSRNAGAFTISMNSSAIGNETRKRLMFRRVV